MADTTLVRENDYFINISLYFGPPKLLGSVCRVPNKLRVRSTGVVDPGEVEEDTIDKIVGVEDPPDLGSNLSANRDNIFKY